MQSELTHVQHGSMLTVLAGRREMRLARVVVLISAVFFLAIAPFATIPLAQVPAFIPIYITAFAISDLITAALLFGQFNFLRSRSLLVLASGYLFTAFITCAYILIFPGLFAPSGLIGAGLQTTSAMYMFWHAGFPLVIIAYALLKDPGSEAIGTNVRSRGRTRSAILGSIATVLIIVCGFTLFATAGNAYIPVFLQGNRATNLGRIVLSAIWMLSLLALFVLWWRRPHSVLDLWLMVVMCVWLFDIALSAIINTGRYDLGWYAGRIYGLVAASFLMIVLLLENVANYAQLAQLSAKLSVANESLAQLSLHDKLTGLANRRYFDSYLVDQIAVARRYQRMLALVLYDVDYFKSYNDHYGHQVGDACLQQVAATLRSICRRSTDMAARYGGEEFAMILPDTTLIGAAKIAETARDAVAQLHIPHAHSPITPHITISGGVAILFWTPDMSVEQLIAGADQALYAAKHQGRNRIVSITTTPEELAVGTLVFGQPNTAESKRTLS